MTAILITPTTGYARATPEFIDFDVPLKPSLGGVEQTLQRLGSRWALDIELPPVREGTDFRALLAQLVPARRAGASYPWPQPGLNNVYPAGPPAVVRGSGQYGSTLFIAGSTYTVKAGQFFSMASGGRRYLHMVTADTAITGSGASVPIYPMLRVSPLDNDVITFNGPVIEGKLAGTSFAWDHMPTDWVPLSFRIEEIA